MPYPLIYYFSSPYCAPCKNVERMLGEINVSLFGNKLRIKKVDIASDLETAQKFNVISVPTIIIGSIRLTLVIDKNELTDAILQGFISSVSFEEEEEEESEEANSGEAGGPTPIIEEKPIAGGHRNPPGV
jgi:thiol-disulfide isomerase/thioredoxin